MNPSFDTDLAAWFELTKKLAQIKEQEMELRKKLFVEAFPAPVEGTNSFNLPAGYVLKGQYKLDRKVDVAAFNQLQPTLREKLVPVDKLLKWEPSVVIAEYRTLSKELLHFFDQILIIKPGAPAMEIVLPKKK